jgi:uncharacterized membrane protein
VIVNPAPFRTLRNAERNREQRLADMITHFSGTMTFVGLHALWFAAWIVYNVSSGHPFDRFPFGLLTLIVSLEAIFLSTFVLISQNEQGKRDDKREMNDHLTDLWSEAWSEVIGERLGIDPAEVRKKYMQRVKEEDERAVSGS